MVFSAIAGCTPKMARPVSFLSIEKTIAKKYCQRIGESVQGRPIDCCVFGDGEDVIFIIASIHGNEPAGTPLVEKLIEYLDENPELLVGRKVVLLPIANPDGLAGNWRFNANGVDLNRNFAAANRINNKRFGLKAMSEPEAIVIDELIRKYQPDRMVSIHQLVGSYTKIPYMRHLKRRRVSALIDYDGDAEALAKIMSARTGLAVKKMGAYPGSLGSYAGIELGIGIVTLELPKRATGYDSDKLWELYGDGLIAAITFSNDM